MSERAGNAGGQRTVEVSNLLFPEDSMGTFASSLQRRLDPLCRLAK
jgi:hypothetical protein